MKIYTRTGDDGTTGIFGGDRVKKTHPRIRAYGTVDEANAQIGVAVAILAEFEECGAVRRELEEIQSSLFVLGADLATPLASQSSAPRISDQHVANVERQIDLISADLPELQNFILPGGSVAAATLHVARTVCRRAERLTVDLAAEEEINPETIVFLNRLADLLFVMSRQVNALLKVEDVVWRHQRG
jgi:cob(I)alamin adenosyltransferase